ncbi:hypothetical protein ABK040_015794 [Willaertia magna]
MLRRKSNKNNKSKNTLRNPILKGNFQFLENIEIKSLIGVNNNLNNLLNLKIENENFINKNLLQLFLNKKLKYMDVDDFITKITTITHEKISNDYGWGNIVNYDQNRIINPQIIILTNKGKLFTFGNNIYQPNKNLNNNVLNNYRVFNNNYNNNLNNINLPITPLDLFLGNKKITEKIIDIISGISHCIILTENGNIYKLIAKKSQSTCSLYLKNILNVKKIVCGINFTIILTNDNNVYYDEHKVYDPPFGNLEKNNDELIDVTCGAHHVLFLTKKGKLFRFLSNKNGQSGSDLVEYFYKINEWPREQFPFLEKIIQTACGYNHTMLLTERGRVFVCGGNENGQLGIGIKCISKYELTLVSNFKKINFTTNNFYHATTLNGNEKIIGIYANFDQSIFVTNFGNIFGCGKKLNNYNNNNYNDDKKEEEFIMNEPTQWNISAYRPDSSIYLFIYSFANLIIILTRQKIDNLFILENFKKRLIDSKLNDITIFI